MSPLRENQPVYGLVAFLPNKPVPVESMLGPLLGLQLRLDFVLTKHFLADIFNTKPARRKSRVTNVYIIIQERFSTATRVHTSNDKKEKKRKKKSTIDYSKAKPQPQRPKKQHKQLQLSINQTKRQLNPIPKRSNLQIPRINHSLHSFRTSSRSPISSSTNPSHTHTPIRTTTTIPPTQIKPIQKIKSRKRQIILRPSATTSHSRIRV
jgi:hypothetical protein